MYKRILGLSVVLLSGCSTLSSDDDFSDAIKEVTRKHNYVSIEAKDIVPIENQSVGASALKNTSQLIANYATSEKKSPSSYMAVELSYFKASYSYSSVVIDGNERKIEPYSVSTESCSEHCTATQYFTFPIDNNEIELAAQKGLTYVAKTQNEISKLSFTIPAGYFQAVLDEKALQFQYTPAVVMAQPIIETKAEETKPVEMAKYWFNEATAVEQEQFTEWAFANRKSISTTLNSDSKSLEMLSYWYKKASTEDKAQILTWLLNI
ncbi:hypothetical protein ERW49_00535 [Aliivibrio finisterrensis]|uniref:DUF2057 domain-containing protein n=1 Tax=Aliivibrio finisterrensis TaxID=511998 RepID=A0A4Q5KPF0_9GAMM|nr:MULTISPECIES: hypothetical protein [Aliivibrio]MDD9174527.1 hypothetical protein [Aliivibrio sp. S3TY1]MDD9191606.1 hypothetical protein [Aliivibrio sp. S2TY2]RYU48485.1 hypothetical protein ERW49_00535 [Aliivibrio finisterrensis]